MANNLRISLDAGMRGRHWKADEDILREIVQHSHKYGRLQMAGESNSFAILPRRHLHLYAIIYLGLWVGSVVLRNLNLTFPPKKTLLLFANTLYLLIRYIVNRSFYHCHLEKMFLLKFTYNVCLLNILLHFCSW